jgi:hypothetical protein
MKINEVPMLEIHDETSGIKQLDQRRVWHERKPDVLSVALISFVSGFLAAATLFLFLK